MLGLLRTKLEAFVFGEDFVCGCADEFYEVFFVFLFELETDYFWLVMFVADP